jgi:hypothetical protein
MIHLMPCRNLAFMYSDGPSSLVWSKLGQLHLFHQWECLKWNGHGPSVSCVMWPLGFHICEETSISATTLPDVFSLLPPNYVCCLIALWKCLLDGKVLQVPCAIFFYGSVAHFRLIRNRGVISAIRPPSRNQNFLGSIVCKWYIRWRTVL